jgi:hypothetical protein
MTDAAAVQDGEGCHVSPLPQIGLQLTHSSLWSPAKASEIDRFEVELRRGSAGSNRRVGVAQPVRAESGCWSFPRPLVGGLASGPFRHQRRTDMTANRLFYAPDKTQDEISV